MGARSSWTPRTDRTGSPRRGGRDRDLSLEDLLDAHFDAEGHLANIGRGTRQRLEERFEPRPPAMGVEDLERAVERLARGLEAMERGGRPGRRLADRLQEPRPSRRYEGRGDWSDDGWGEEAAGDDGQFVTYGLDRLEARLEAISRELERRSGPPASQEEHEEGDPAFVEENTAPPAYEEPAADRYGPAAEFYVVEEEADASPDPSLGDPSLGAPSFGAPPAQSSADVIDLSGSFGADWDDAAEYETPSLAVAPRRSSDAGAPDAGDDIASAELRRHLEALESRVEFLQERGDFEEMQRVRGELHSLGDRLEEVDRNGNSLSGHLREATQRIAALEAGIALAQVQAEGMEDVRARLSEIEGDLDDARELAARMGEVSDRVGGLEGGYGEVSAIRSRMGEIETKLAATRNLAGNRLGELQDRLADLAERLEEQEANPQLVEALRDSHSELMERIDRIEGMAQTFVAPEDLDRRLAEMRGSLDTLGSQEDLSRIEAQLLAFADRIDAIPAGLAERAATERMETQLQALAAEFVELRRRRDTGTVELGARIGELAASIEALRADHARIDLEPIERRFTDLAGRLDRDRRAGAEMVSRLDGRLSRLASLMNREEDETSSRLLAEIDGKLDALVDAVAARDAAGIEAGIAALDGRLGAVAERLDGVGGDLSEKILAALGKRLSAFEEHLRQDPAPLAETVTGRIVETIGGRLEALAEAVAAHDPADIRRSFESIDRNLDALKSASGKTGTETVSAVKALESRLDALAQAVATNDAGDFRRSFAAIDNALGELKSSVGSADSTALVQKLDSRLDGLAKSVASNDVAGLRKELEVIGRGLGELKAVAARTGGEVSTAIVASLGSRLDDLADAVAASDVPGLRHQIIGLERGLGEVKAAAAKSGSEISGAVVAALGERIDEIAGKLGGHDPQELRAAIAAIGRRLTDLKGQVEKADGETSAKLVAGLDKKIDELAERLRSQDPLEAIGRVGRISEERLAPIAERLSTIEEGIHGLADRATDTRSLQSQLDGILHRLELIDSRGFDPDRLLSLVDRLEAQFEASASDDRLDRIGSTLESAPARFAELVRNHSPSGGDDERMGRLEEKLDQLARAINAGGEWLDPQEIAETRSDITALRRELRSLPGLGDGEGGLAALMNTVAERLETLSERPPVTGRDLDDHMERIVQLLDDPEHGRFALRHVEANLKAIEARLAELGSASEQARGGDGEAELNRMTAIAQSLTGDLEALREAASDSERKTRDSLESVQDTLEAVVKRMAFLERDADAAVRPALDEAPRSAGEAFLGLPLALDAVRDGGAPEGSAILSAPSAQTASDETTSGEAGEADETGDNDASPAVSVAEAGTVEPSNPEPRLDDDEPELHYAAFAAPDAASQEAGPTGAVAAETGADVVAETAQPGLLGRLTSRQLLKRATGGRAESFSPDTDEVEEPADLPLEPGTQDPLDSDLIDAPSSDSGPRGRVAAGEEAKTPDASGWRRGGAAADDFLASARRAAQAAAAEAAEAESQQPKRLGRLRGLIGRRRSLLAGVLVLAVALAAYEMMQMRDDGADTIETASLEAEPVAAPLPPEPQLAALAAPEAADIPPASDDTAASPASSDIAAATGIDPELDTAALPPAPVAPASTGESASADPVEEEAAIAALDPATAADANAADMPAAPPARPLAEPADLPAAIGPVQLADAARAGDPAAEFEIAARYADGRGVPQDLTEAVTWYERAAADDFAPAQYRLGSIFENGIGVPKDLARAQEYYRTAAAAGNVKAMHNLAVLYAEGAGGDPDLEAAAELFRTAAEFGVRDSQFNIGILHARGIGVPQDLVEAYKWFAVAAASGDTESTQRRDAVAEAMSAADLARGQAEAEAFTQRPLDPAANIVPTPEDGWGAAGGTTSAIDTPAIIEQVQAALVELGYEVGPVDGVPGARTREALSSFQDGAGLPATGEIDDATLSALGRTAG